MIMSSLAVCAHCYDIHIYIYIRVYILRSVCVSVCLSIVFEVVSAGGSRRRRRMGKLGAGMCATQIKKRIY